MVCSLIGYQMGGISYINKVHSFEGMIIDFRFSSNFFPICNYMYMYTVVNMYV